MNKIDKRPFASETKRRGCLWWAIRILILLVVVTALPFLAGYIVETRALSQLPEKYPPPGEMVDIGEYSIHLHCTGNPSDRPVVVVSSGYSMSSLHWALVQPKIAKFTRICAYDRPGSGYSFEGLEPRTFRQEADALRTSLSEAGIEGPYVLVGHSYGGAVLQVYAIQHPEDVTGMVMVDTRTRDSKARYPVEYVQAAEKRSQGGAVFSVPGIFRTMNWFGIFRTTPATDPFFSKLPSDLQQVAYDLDYNSRLFTFQTVMNRADAESEKQFAEEGPLPDIPLIVITRGIPETPLPGVDADTARQYEQVWYELQAELARETSDGTLIVAEESGHNIIVDQPNIVVDSILAMVEKARDE